MSTSIQWTQTATPKGVLPTECPISFPKGLLSCGRAALGADISPERCTSLWLPSIPDHTAPGACGGWPRPPQSRSERSLCPSAAQSVPPPRTRSSAPPSRSARFRRGVAVSGDYAFVANRAGNTVSVIDTTATPPAVTDTIAVGTNPWAVAASGDRAYVTNFSAGTVSVIDTAAVPPAVVVDTISVGSQLWEGSGQRGSRLHHPRRQRHGLGHRHHRRPAHCHRHHQGRQESVRGGGQR